MLERADTTSAYIWIIFKHFLFIQKLSTKKINVLFFTQNKSPEIKSV